MSDRGLRYWLNWPHTRQDHVVAFVIFFGLTLLGGYDNRPVVAIIAALVTVLLGIRLMAWNAEAAATGEEEDADLIPTFEDDDERGRDHRRTGRRDDGRENR